MVDVVVTYLKPLSALLVMTSLIVSRRLFMTGFEEMEEFVGVLCSGFDDQVLPELQRSD